MSGTSTRPICNICNNRPGRLARKVGDKRYWHKTCNDCGGRRCYRISKATTCSRCGFIPEHKCQLDVDHIDGNHANNDPTNLATLCANCHRLKSHLNKDTHV